MTANGELLCCSVGARTFAFRSADVRHVARVEHMRTAGPADGRTGTLKISGHTIPVFKLGAVLDRPEVERSRSPQHIAVTGDPGTMVGWLVDRIARTMVPDASAVAALPEIVGTPATAWFDALVNLDETAVLRLTPHNLLPRSAPAVRHTAATRPAGRSSQPATAPLVVLFSTAALPNSDATRYALSARQIVAVSQPQPLIAVPGSASYVIGVSWWRDTVVPLLDFRGPEARAAARDRWLVTRCGGRLGSTLVALPIASDVSVRRPAPANERLSATACPSLAAGLFRVDHETVALLDLDRLFPPPIN